MNYDITPELITCLRVARLYADRSYARRLQVGAVIFHVPSRTIIGTGYNGTPPGEENVMETEDNMTVSHAIHAEVNAIKKIPWYLRFRLKHSLMVITHSPCRDCADRILYAGIPAVYFGERYRCNTGIDLLQQHGVLVRRLYDAP
jgi:deoxycytidylate deaminase